MLGQSLRLRHLRTTPLMAAPGLDTLSKGREHKGEEEEISLRPLEGLEKGTCCSKITQYGPRPNVDIWPKSIEH